MTTTTQPKPKAKSRYAKQGAPQGDFAAGERTQPPVPEIDDFATGEHTLPVPENPALVDTLPPVLAVPAKKA
jgi:hypothetical protein